MRFQLPSRNRHDGMSIPAALARATRYASKTRFPFVDRFLTVSEAQLASRLPPIARRAAVVSVLLIAMAPIGFSVAGDGPEGPRAALDGMSFVGKLGPDGKPPDSDDILYFRDGQFWSKNCVPCGFRPGAYFVRFVDDGIEFQGEMESEDRGRFHYTGIVRNGQLTAEITWRKDRWYWSIDKAFRFEGKASEISHITSAQRAREIALIAEPGPEDCRL